MQTSPLLKTHHLECDLLVAGGGPAGVPAAVAAARAGLKVILCQDRPVLGGNASSEVRMHIVGANAGRQTDDWSIEARESGIIEEIRLENAVCNPQRSPSIFDLILYNKCKEEPNLQLLLNTAVTNVKKNGDLIEEAEALRLSTEDRYIIRAKLFADCTGDGTLGAAAGADFTMGREANAEYGETHGQDVADKKTLGSTLLFMARKHDKPVPFKAPAWARKFTREDFNFRADFWKNPDSNSFEYGYWWLEWGGQLDTIKDNEAIRDELMRILLGVWDFIKNSGEHGAENWALDWFGAIPGKRESRRFVGLHRLCEGDVFQAIDFPDAIAYGGWPIDTHPPQGIDAPEERPCTAHHLPYLYSIPLRSCVSANVPNLLFAGRNISATHVAFATTRVMATCALMGEGVGVAAAHAIKHGILPKELIADEAKMKALQQHLVREDNFLPGIREDACANLAYQAKITASSEQADGPASNVISGQNRCVAGERGVRPDLIAPGSHRWMSDPAAGLPAWIELRWDKPVEIAQVDLTFDTGLQRYLTLTYDDTYLSWMKWHAQPETLRDFILEAETDTGWTPLDTVEGNWERRYRKTLAAPLHVKALRLRISATQGLDHARLIRFAAFGAV